MTETTMVTPRTFCSGCGDAVASVNPESKRGPCCHGLPAPWHRGTDGLYNQHTDPGDYAEDLDAVGGYHCEHCGGASFTLTARQRVDTSETEEPNLNAVGFCWDDFTNVEASCDHCGRDVPSGAIVGDYPRRT